MSEQQEIIETDRREQLRAVAEGYFASLERRNFDGIPYDDDVVLRAPLVPGGVHQPLVGKEALRTVWWPPLEQVLGRVKIIEHYFNESLTAVVTEAEIHILNPPAVLRVADRFMVNDAGKIIEQENHFDPRDITNPGWHRA
jgi:hypothetical protein